PRASPTSTPRATLAAVTTRAWTSSTRSSRSPSRGRAPCSGSTTPTSSPTAARRPTSPRCWPCASLATPSWASACPPGARGLGGGDLLLAGRGLAVEDPRVAGGQLALAGLGEHQRGGRGR